MGLDACILVKTTDGKEPALCDQMPSYVSIIAADECFDVDATHEIDTRWRYYADGYERGPWPDICSVIMKLFACENVETVWYFSDSHESGEPITKQKLFYLCEHYMTVGDRPYRRT